MPDDRSARDVAERRADRAAIERLAAELVKSLAARLEKTGLAEIEVREGGGRVRVRRAVGSAPPPAAHEGVSRHHRSGGGLVAVGPGSGDGSANGGSARSQDSGIATSPAVGYFSPRDGIAAGSPVTAGERIGSVEVLGVAHEVVAPIDGLVDEVLIAPGQAVEYGEHLLTVVPPSGGLDQTPVAES